MIDDDGVFELVFVVNWFVLEEWLMSFEVGVNGSDGNSDMLSVNVGFDFECVFEFFELMVKICYSMSYNN